MLKGQAGQNGPMTQSPAHQEGEQLHVSGVFIVLLELALVVENLLPILVVIQWMPKYARGVGDRLIVAFSVTCILSALVPTPLGLASYFSGSWYGGSPTCTTYQVTSTWCNISSLALLTYIGINCHCAVKRLVRLKPSDQHLHFRQTSSAYTQVRNSAANETQENSQSFAMINGSAHVNVAMETHFDISENLQNHCATSECIDYTSLTENNDQLYNINTNGENLEHIPSRSCIETNDEHIETNGGLHFAHTLPAHECITCHHSSNHDRLHEEEINPLKPETSHASKQEACANNPHSGDVIPKNNNKNNTSIDIQQQTHVKFDSSGSGMRTTNFRSRDFVSLTLFFLFAVTLAISSLPVIGFGPQHETSERLCRAWIVPTPSQSKEQVFFILFLSFVYLCLFLGSVSGGSVCYQVSRRMGAERKRSSRLYHQEQNTPDLGQLVVLDDLKRHYSLCCLVWAGVLTWIPIAVMLTLQKSGVQVSEATLMYSNIATSLPGLLNPLLYSLVLARYRTGYKAVFERCFRKRKQKARRMKSFSRGFPDEGGLETTVTSSADGSHECSHVRSNPTYDCPLGEDDDSYNDYYDDEDEEEEDEDYFPDDKEDEDKLSHLEGVCRETSLNEKTPLQVQKPLLISRVSGDGTSGVKVTCAKHSQSRQHFSSHVNDSDETCLLPTSRLSTLEETGL